MRRYVPLLLLLAVLAPTAAQAQNSSGDADDSALVLSGKMSDIPIEEFLQLTAEVQKLKFLYDQKLVQSRTVTVVAPKEGFAIPRGAMFSVLQTFLKQFSLILMPFGEDTESSIRLYEIINSQQAAGQTDEVIFYDDLDDWTDTSANFVTLVVNLQYADAQSVFNGLRTFAGARAGGTNVSPIQGVNALLLADYSYNIRRMAQIIQLMDQPPRSPRLEVINIDHIDAEELVQSLNALLTARQTLQQTAQNRPNSREDETLVQVEVAPYVNAIMVTGYDAGIELVRDLVAKLDIEIPGATTGRMHFYPCKNVQAVELSDTLTELIGVGLPTGQPGAPGQPVIGGQSENAPTIVPDENTNSLLIIASSTDYAELKKIIDKLDVRRPQVMIEAVILEVSDDDDFLFGVELASVDGFAENSNEPRASFGTNFGYSEVVDSSGVPIGTGGGVPSGRNPIIGQGGIFAIHKGGALDIPLLVRFLKTQSDTNILSQPMLITNDNEEATIDITTEIQLVQLNNLGAGAGTTTSGGDFVEAGITLTVTPQISQDGYITLSIDLDISAFVGESPTPGVSPPKRSRKIQTFVTVPDGNTVAIGGLKSAESSKTVQKIPLLGDIPLLGELFKSQRTTQRNTNLYIFCRPVILRDANFDDYKNLSREILEEAKGQVIDAPANRRFFKRAIADYENDRKAAPGTPVRAFDYQGLDTND